MYIFLLQLSIFEVIVINDLKNILNAQNIECRIIRNDNKIKCMNKWEK